MKEAQQDRDRLCREIAGLLDRQAELQQKLAVTMSALGAIAEGDAGRSGPHSQTLTLRQIQRQLVALGSQMAEIQVAVGAVTRLATTQASRLDEMLESRTWRALTGLGGMLLRLRGRR